MDPPRKETGLEGKNQKGIRTYRCVRWDGSRSWSDRDLVAFREDVRYDASSRYDGFIPSNRNGATMEERKLAYLDVAVSKRVLGRVILEMRDDVTPKTCHNFLLLCSNPIGSKQTYVGTRFHRIIPGFMCQGGDYERGDGTGGESVYGGKFEDENFVLKHDRAGVLSMANSGPNTNGSQFFITTAPAEWLDGKHVVFGHVCSGMDVVRQVEMLGNSDGKPKKRVHIVQCGLLEPVASPSTRSGQLLRDSAGIRPDTGDARDIEESQKRQIDTRIHVDGEKKPLEVASAGAADEIDDEIPPEDLENMDARQRKFFELRLKLNKARHLNRKAVVAEERRKENPGREQAEQKRKMLEENKKKWEEQLQHAGLSSKQSHRLESFDQAQRKYKKQKKDESFGWDAYNQESTYRAYEKRASKIEPDMKTYSRLKEDNDNFYQEKEILAYGKAPKLPEENVERMVSELRSAEERRAKFSRRRAYRESQDVDHINKRNEAFNKKLDRAFGQFTSEIKANLERGTALPDT